jgi:branched-chain amino acid transport system substrate-binding protein
MFHKKALSLAIAAGVFAVASAASAQTVVRIGHVGPVSGNIAHLGKDNENGFKMAIEDLNAQNLTIGGQRIRFEGLTEDDAADPRQGTAAAQKLVDAKVSGVIGHLNSGTTIPASRLYHDAGIVQISPSSTNPRYTQQGFKTAFRVVAHDGPLGQTLGRYAAKELKAKRIAVIDDRTAYGQGVADEFIKGAQAEGAQVVSRQFTNDKATDFQAILTTIKAQNPDLVFFGGMDSVGGPMLRQMNQLGMQNVKFMGGDGICSPQLPNLAGGAAAMGNDRVWCAKAGGIAKGSEYEKKMADFRARYQQKFGIPVQIYAPYVYDATMVMVEAMKRANSTDPTKYNAEMFNVKYNGVTGPISFDERGDIKGGALTLITYKGDKLTEVSVVPAVTPL